MTETPITQLTDAELSANGITADEVRARRDIHADLTQRYAPSGAAELQLVRQAATAVLRGDEHIQRILASLEKLQEERRQQERSPFDIGLPKL
jgi:hypothetical protein